MSFICQECKKTVFGPQFKKITETREKVYKEKIPGSDPVRYKITGKGSEIVKEINVCQECN